MVPALIRRPRFETSPLALTRDIDDMFDQMMQSWRGSEWNWADNQTASYPCDIREDDGRILVDAELPGFTRNEVKVTLDSGVLNIVAEHKEEQKKTEGARSYLQERRYSRIQRSITLPTSVNESKVDASLKDGVLHLTLQKSEQGSPHQIAIK